MAKPAERILMSNAGQHLDDCILKRLTCASANPPQNGFQFGKSAFNRRKVGGIGGQMEELASSRLDGLFDSGSQVN